MVCAVFNRHHAKINFPLQPLDSSSAILCDGLGGLRADVEWASGNHQRQIRESL